jgi:exodeoxyribonuclease VII large subunit
MNSEPALTVSEFVAVFNQTLEYAYPSVIITGELANFRVSKNRWVYFDLKDQTATVRFFGSVHQLPGPLTDGMMVAVRGAPRLHPQYNFSVNVLSIRPVGEGSIKKAAALLEAKLRAEGLFDVERKRRLPYPPAHVGLVTSLESAAYRDFIKVLAGRWGGLGVSVVDVQVQGEPAPAQIAAAIAQLNQLATPPEVLIVIRGGGSAEDLAAFSTEQVTRAVAASRIPTLVAIGHEVDISLAELAADQRASTPSNAAELLVPDRRAALVAARGRRANLAHFAKTHVHTAVAGLAVHRRTLQDSTLQIADQAKRQLSLQYQLLQAFNPRAALQRGYALARKDGQVIHSGHLTAPGDHLSLELSDAMLAVTVKAVTMKKEQTNGKK